jgi:uncharacterized membrane protein
MPPRSSRSPQLAASRAGRGASPVNPEVPNIHAVIELERETVRERSRLERFTDAVSIAAGSSWFVVVHVVWFAFWIVMNVKLRPFDPYPFNLLTLAVSLEAIVLTSFVLMTQDRMTRLADRREHLDLQIDILAEQELTAILRVVCLVAERVGVNVAEFEPKIAQLLQRTDVQRLASELDQELAVKGDEVPPRSP